MKEENTLTQCMCDFCGQILEADQETMRRAGQDEKIAAKLICDCDKAKLFCRRYTIMEKGIEMVDNICGRYSGNQLDADTVNILHSAIKRIVDRKITGIVLNISAKEKVEIKLGDKGIKCSRQVKETEADECRF